LLRPSGMTMLDKVTCDVEWTRDDSGEIGLEVWTVQWAMAFEPLQFHHVDSAALYFANTMAVARGGEATPEDEFPDLEAVTVTLDMPGDTEDQSTEIQTNG